jgi:rRNA maturation RNase YbeY
VKASVAASPRTARAAGFEGVVSFFRSLAGRCPPRGASVEIHWVGARTMAVLKRAYRRCAGGGEILTFSYGRFAGSVPESPLGEIFLCWARVRRRAERKGVPPKAYAARLLVHGLFHLRGYRHDTAEEAGRMEKAERAFLRGCVSERALKRLFD